MINIQLFGNAYKITWRDHIAIKKVSIIPTSLDIII